MTKEPTRYERACEAHPLAKIVLEQLGGGEDAIGDAIQAGEHGADAGWSGFTWHSDTVPFSQTHKRAILRCAGELAHEIGEGNAVALVQGFRCLKDYRDDVADVLTGCSDDEDASTVVWNALAWFALEEVGRSLAGADLDDDDAEEAEGGGDAN